MMIMMTVLNIKARLCETKHVNTKMKCHACNVAARQWQKCKPSIYYHTKNIKYIHSRNGSQMVTLQLRVL